jgi:hypothetical protein
MHTSSIENEESNMHDDGSDESDKESEKSDHGNVNEEVEDEEEGFWTLLIRQTVKHIHDRRKSQGQTGFLDNMNHVDDLLEGNTLTSIINKMKEVFLAAKQMVDASDNDPLFEMMQEKATKIVDKFEGIEDDFEEQAQDMVWKKYETFIKKKLGDNAEELSPLVSCDNDDDDDNCDMA